MLDFLFWWATYFVVGASAMLLTGSIYAGLAAMLVVFVVSLFFTGPFGGF